MYALVILGGIAAALFLYHRQAEAAGAQVSAASGFTTPITDAATVRQYQSIVATAIASGQFGATYVPPITIADYGAGDVDGNPTNKRWMTVLSVIQRDVNTSLLTVPAGKLPAGFPAQLRTDGVLDYATAVALTDE